MAQSFIADSESSMSLKSRQIHVPQWARARQLELAYSTQLGASIIGESEDILANASDTGLSGKVQLVLTSPPYPLNRKKAYGNKTGNAYKKWLQNYAVRLRNVLTPSGSIVIEMGNAWEPGLPVMSTLALEALMAFKKAADLNLCQEFIWHNSAKLPTPAQWVTIERIRVKDSYTRLWWLSPSPRPKADNRRVLLPYSKSMRRLLKQQRYNAGRRPSEHVISATGFLTDHGGAIPSNVLDEDRFVPDSLLVGANTESADPYHKYCKERGLDPHPARMPLGLATFFVRLCTEPGDLVLDPFGGSNTTGAAADSNQRRWLTIEQNPEYARAGVGRFPQLTAAMDARDLEHSP
jgi:site-specific DNA-methyltransferase (cytosine-N4-specific)